jgi:hypothetical protein
MPGDIFDRSFLPEENHPRLLETGLVNQPAECDTFGLEVTLQGADADPSHFGYPTDAWSPRPESRLDRLSHRVNQIRGWGAGLQWSIVGASFAPLFRAEDTDVCRSRFGISKLVYLVLSSIRASDRDSNREDLRTAL